MEGGSPRHQRRQESCPLSEYVQAFLLGPDCFLKFLYDSRCACGFQRNGGTLAYGLFHSLLGGVLEGSPTS